jgi:AbrB family looped-hinge helix DNA binding protein
METKIDGFGRVVIPRKLRTSLGLTPGTQVRITEENSRIVLEPVQGEPMVREKEGVWVYGGEAAGDIAGAVQAAREARSAKESGGIKP